MLVRKKKCIFILLMGWGGGGGGGVRVGYLPEAEENLFLLFGRALP